MKKQQQPLVSIILVHYQTPQILQNNLKILSNLDDKTSFEVIVVNNDQTSLQKLQKICRIKNKSWPSRKIILMQAPQNLGFGGGNNLGAQKAQGQFLFFLNPDTEVSPGSIDQLVTFLKNQPQVGVAAPTLLKSDHQPFEIQGSRELTPLTAIMSHSLLHKIWPNNPIAKKHYATQRDTKKNQQLAAVPGSAFMIRASLFKRIGGFDENFFLYYEEYDLGRRVTQAGYKIYLLSQPKIIHHWKKSTQTVNKLKVKKKLLSIEQIHRQSRFYYFKKHFGFLKALITEFFLRISAQSLWMFLILSIYTALMIGVISWGIPKDKQIFTYHMDEWHQLMSLKNIAQYASPNVAGSAHGPMWHFLISGVYLFFFYLIGIVNPYQVTSYLTELNSQQHIFQILRLNTLLFGIATIFLLFLILKKHFRHNPFWGVVFFTFSPIWLSLSNYFKYDIALTFWLTLTFYQIFHFAKKNSLKNFVLVSILAALTVATKISALPILPLIIFVYFLWQKNPRQNLSILGWGVSAFLLTFLLVGVPDLWLKTSDYSEYFSSNLLSNPATSSNFNLKNKLPLFVITDQFPRIFGGSFAILSWLAVISAILTILKTSKNNKKLIFLLLSLGIFILSLIPLKIYATGNRLLVLLPMLALLISAFIHKISQKLSPQKRKLFNIGLIILTLWQILTALNWIKIKHAPDPRLAASLWLQQNLEVNTKIGIENPPIYQRLPDIVLHEYYLHQTNNQQQTSFSYQIISPDDQKFPTVVILTNQTISEHQFSSPQKEILKKLNRNHYQLVAEFKPPLSTYQQQENNFNFLWTNLVPTSIISIYQHPAYANKTL